MSNDTIRQAVATQLGTIAPSVEDSVVNHFVQIEIARRSELVVAGLNKHAELVKEGKKIGGPDIVAYNADGSVKDSSFSKPRLDAVNKNNDAIAKLERAIDKAINGDTDELVKLTSNQK